MSIGRFVISLGVARASLVALTLPFMTAPSARATAQSSAPLHAPTTAVRKRVEIPPAPQLWMRTARIAPADPVASGYFGQAVDDDTIGARQRGNAYVFVRDNGVWTQQAKIIPPSSDNSFEETIALDGDNLVIGWPQDDATSLSSWHGVAWIYHRTGVAWALEGVTGGLPVGQVGKDVAVVGDVAIITGALPKDDIEVHRRLGQSWSVVQSINCCPGASFLIHSLAMDASTLVILTGMNSGPAENYAAAVHFYELDRNGSWTFRQTLAVRHAAAMDQFGYDIELSGDRVVVGAALDDAFGVDAGAVYTFVREGGVWLEEASIGPCATGVLGFGRSIAFVGSTLVVSARQRTDTTKVEEYRSAGYVLELTASGWTTVQTLTIPEQINQPGMSVALDGHTLVVGSMSEDVPLANSGALYVFEKQDALGGNFCFGDGSGTACPCNNPGQAGSGCANAYSAVGARLDAYGTASITDDRLLLSCRGVTPGTNAFFVQGDAREANGAGVPYRDGLRCITGSLVSLGTAPSCDGNATFPPAHVPSLSVLGSIPPVGATRYYQVRYASPGPCATGTNFTNAVAIEWAP